MTLPITDREDFDQMESASEHQNESDEGRHCGRGNELIPQRKETKQDHGNATGNRPTTGDLGNRNLGNG